MSDVTSGGRGGRRRIAGQRRTTDRPLPDEVEQPAVEVEEPAARGPGAPGFFHATLSRVAGS